RFEQNGLCADSSGREHHPGVRGRREDHLRSETGLIAMGERVVAGERRPSPLLLEPVDSCCAGAVLPSAPGSLLSVSPAERPSTPGAEGSLPASQLSSLSLKENCHVQ